MAGEASAVVRAPQNEAVVAIAGLNHSYGEGQLRRQILFDVHLDIQPGEILILTGPSGGGKTTLLSLMGGLRSVQEGSLRVLGQELNGASAAEVVGVRKKIGYIFQAHNLLDALTALQNVQMALRLQPGYSRLSRRQVRDTCLRILQSVGLERHAHHHANQMSGGQRQRVAIARALVSDPKMILADEPTASLDKQSGRDIVEIMQRLAKEQGCTVFLVTHDNRILDIADRVIDLEDGRLTSFTNAVAAGTRQLLTMLAEQNRKGQLTRHVKDLTDKQFAQMLERVTGEFEQLLYISEVSHSEAFESMLDQVLEAFTLKVGQILHAERVTLFLVDEAKGELWSKVAQSDGQRPLTIRMPVSEGIAGQVATTGVARNISDVYEDPLFNRDIDQRTGYRTRSMLCLPIQNRRGQLFAVAQLLNKNGGEPFDTDDERRLSEFAALIGVMLESWWRMTRSTPTPDAQPATPNRGV